MDSAKPRDELEMQAIARTWDGDSPRRPSFDLFKRCERTFDRTVIVVRRQWWSDGRFGVGRRTISQAQARQPK